jgi:hypothetical protein
MSTVVIIADHDDRDLNRVQRSLGDRGLQVVRLELGLSEQSWDISFDLRQFTLMCNGELVNDELMAGVALIVYRRWMMIPAAPIRVTGLDSSADREFAEREWAASLASVLRHIEDGFPSATWANAVSRSDNQKQWMLSIALAEGLPVPETLIGTQLPGGRLSEGSFVAKAVAVNEHLADGRHFPTTVLNPEQLKSLGMMRASCPSCVQRRVDVEYELRIVVAFGEMAALKLVSHRSAGDIRLLDSDELDVEVTECPSRLADMLISLTKRLGLGLCSYDVLIDEAGDAHLVDITPNGSWWFFEDQLDTPFVSESVAAALTNVVQYA